MLGAEWNCLFRVTLYPSFHHRFQRQILILLRALDFFSPMWVPLHVVVLKTHCDHVIQVAQGHWPTPSSPYCSACSDVLCQLPFWTFWHHCCFFHPFSSSPGVDLLLPCLPSPCCCPFSQTSADAICPLTLALLRLPHSTWCWPFLISAFNACHSYFFSLMEGFIVW